MPGRIERRDADVRVRERRRHAIVRDAARELHAGHAGGRAFRRRALGAVADKDAAEAVVAGGVQPREGGRQMFGAVPRAKRARKHADGARAVHRERRIAGGIRPEAVDVGAPLDLEHGLADRSRRAGCRQTA